MGYSVAVILLLLSCKGLNEQALNVFFTEDLDTAAWYILYNNTTDLVTDMNETVTKASESSICMRGTPSVLVHARV